MEKYKKLLKENGLKITPKRFAIISYFLKNNKYFTPYEIWKFMKKKFKKIGLPTIYRNLEQFEKIGILTRVEGEENRFYYGICKKTNKKHHHHIICTSCHKISDFEICNFGQLKKQVEEITEFDIKEHHLFLKGICQNCKKGV
ncbi:MAG: transcriptional repressor [Candidatus Omnitrophica bacterium]|nr:transcriptional repressor [Candidatus Omnitrophota bacterium]MCM8803061.1 transcriptional repressor [Candidatus Omnitrophota bacterium]